jgi:hypothetical protein
VLLSERYSYSLPFFFPLVNFPIFYLLFFRSIMRFWFYTFSRFCARGFPVWRTDKSLSPSIYSHHDSDRPSFGCILSQFYERGFADRCYRTMVTRVRCIHIAPRTFVLYNLTPHSSNSQPCLCLR